MDIFLPSEFLADLVPYYYPSLTTVVGILIIFGINFILNFIILLVGYLILKKISLIKSWKFLKYTFFVTLGGAIIDFGLSYFLISLLGQLWSSTIHSPDQVEMRMFFLSTGIITGIIGFFVLGFYNYWLSKKYLNLNHKEAIVIGTIMGIFSNPAWFLAYLFSRMSNMIIDPLKIILFLRNS